MLLKFPDSRPFPPSLRFLARLILVTALISFALLAALVLAACSQVRVKAPPGPCGPEKTMVNGRCVAYRPVCAVKEKQHMTYPSAEAAIAAHAIWVADGECCGQASDCERRGSFQQRCVAKTDPATYFLETKEDWYGCLTPANDVHCQCGGPNGAPVCQFTLVENPKFMNCFSRLLPNPPPQEAAPPPDAKAEPH